MTDLTAATPVTRTTCPYCGVGCGVLVQVESNGAVSVRGDPLHQANFGRLCSKGSALGETVGLDDRLLYPMVRGQQVSWDAALSEVAQAFAKVQAQHGADSVAIYVSGQLLTEDYYVANKLAKGFLGTSNIDTNSRLCMSSAVAGQKRAFGADTVPGSYEDLELADLIVLVGSNTAWCHPVVFQRIVKAKADRPSMRVVVVDPRRSATCEGADLHLPLKSGTDVILFNGLLDYLRREDCLDWRFLEQSTEGFGETLAAVKVAGLSIPVVASRCGLAEKDVAEFFRMFARTEKVVSVYSQGINQSSAGVDKVNSILNCHLATGRIGKPGAAPFSITGQPNAMGGREVGGLANMLAAHMDFDKPDNIRRVKEFWRAANMAQQPGLKAVDMFDAVAVGRVKAIWIMATNPVVSMPDADRVKAALAQCEFVVVSDCIKNTDTTAVAHVLLPALAWGEKDGTVTNSDRRISRQRAFLKAPGEAKPDWWALAGVAQKMGFGDAFAYNGPAEIFREHARLSGFENNGARDFDISALAEVSDREFDALVPTQWPITSTAPRGTARMFTNGKFFTASGKAKLISVTYRPPVNLPDAQFTLVLNTGRVRDHWHTMTRTGKSPKLSAHMVEPIVEIHPDDARDYAVEHGSLAQLTTRWGEMVARVVVSADQQRGNVFVPMHWNAQFSAQGRVDALVNPAVDPISGQPELKHTPVRIQAYQLAWHAFALSRQPLDCSELDYWVRAVASSCTRYELAGEEAVADWGVKARAWFGADELLEYEDRRVGRYRGAKVVNGRLEACLFVAPSFDLPARSWLLSLFDMDVLDASARASLLAGKPPVGQIDAGRIVCACFSVGANTIANAIKTRGLSSTDAIGVALKAGTNCGSCLPELRAMLQQSSVAKG